MSYRIIAMSSLLLATACAPTVKSAAREASSTAVDQSVHQLTSEQNKEQLQQAAEDPRVQEAATAMSHEVAEGVAQALSSEQTKQQIASLAAAATAAASREAIQTLTSDQGNKALSRVSAVISDQVASRTLEQLEGRLLSFPDQYVGQKAAATMAVGLSDPALQSSLAEASRVAAQNAASGALSGVWPGWANDGDRVAGLERVRHVGASLLWSGIGIAALLTLGLAFAALYAWARRSAIVHEVRRLEDTVLLLASAARENRDPGQADETWSLIQQTLERGPHARHTPRWDLLRQRSRNH